MPREKILSYVPFGIFAPSSDKINQEFFDFYHKIVGDIANLQQTSESQELGRNIQELGRNIQELGRKCCLHLDQFSQVLENPERIEYWKNYNPNGEEIIQLIQYLQTSQIGHYHHLLAHKYLHRELATNTNWALVFFSSRFSLLQFLRTNIELALCREAAQQIIHAIFHFYQEIGQLTAGKKTQIERKIFPLLAKDYYFASYNAQGLENYVQTIVSKVRNQEARDEHFTGWTTNRPENTVLFFLQQEAGYAWDQLSQGIMFDEEWEHKPSFLDQSKHAIMEANSTGQIIKTFREKVFFLRWNCRSHRQAHDRELALARQISLKTINDNLEKLRMINPDLEITSLDPPTLSRQSTISQIEETTDQAQKVIFEHAFAEVKNNLLLLQSVLPLGVYNFLSGKAEQANSVTELLRLNNSALREFGDFTNYLHHKRKLLFFLNQAQSATQNTNSEELEKIIDELQAAWQDLCEQENDPTTPRLASELKINVYLTRVQQLLADQLLTTGRRKIFAQWEKINQEIVFIRDSEFSHWLEVEDWEQLLNQASLQDLRDQTTYARLSRALDELAARKKELIINYTNWRWGDNPQEWPWKISNSFLRWNYSAELQYLDYQQIIVGEETPQQQDINIFLTDRSLICGQICRLLERMAEVDNLNDDSATWSELRLLQSRINNYLHGEESQTRDRFSLRLLTNPQNSYYVERRQRKLEEKIQSYLEEEQEFIIRLKTECELSRQRPWQNPQTCAKWVKKLNTYANHEWTSEENQQVWLNTRREMTNYWMAFQNLENLLKQAALAVQSQQRSADLAGWLKQLTAWQNTTNPCEVNAREYQNNSQQIADLVYEINEEINLQKLLDRENLEQATQSPEGTARLIEELKRKTFANAIQQKVWRQRQKEIEINQIFLSCILESYQTLDQLLKKDSEDWQELERINYELGLWQQSPQLANDEVVVQNWEHREQRITKRRQEINTKIAAKKQEAETAYWQQQLNNLLTQKSVVISDPSRIKTLQQALVPEQFASDENGINQKEVWSKPENQLAIQEAVQGLEKYYQAFQQLREILNQADELISNSEDWEELNRTAKKIDGWPNQGVYQKNAVEVWQDQVKNRLEAIEEKLFGLQVTAVMEGEEMKNWMEEQAVNEFLPEVVDQVNQGAIEPEAPKADIPLESAEEISRLKALVENPILTTEIKYETPRWVYGAIALLVVLVLLLVLVVSYLAYSFRKAKRERERERRNLKLSKKVFAFE